MTAVTEVQLKSLADAGWTDTAAQPELRPMWDRFLEGGGRIMQSAQVIGPSRGGGWEANHLKDGLRPTEFFQSESLDDVIAETDKWLSGQSPVKGLPPATDQGQGG